MGLLDEAIREHLELKRRRGADPTEIERLEREALGPVRRLAQEPALEAEHAERLDDRYSDYGAVPVEPLGEEGEYQQSAETALEPELGVPTRVHEVEGLDVPGVVPPSEGVLDPGERQQSTPGAVNDDIGSETAEYDVEGEHQDEDEREDMLEETPEFLQDAPEHDRLWFEQRPPRDFDFDG